MEHSHPLLVLVLIAFGLVQALFGYRLFRVLIGVVGALIGFFYAPELIALVTGQLPSTPVALAVGVGLALAFALIAWYVFWLAVFAWGVSVGYAAAVAAFAEPAWLAFVVALAVGVLAILFQRILIVLLTAINGAWLVVSGSAHLFGVLAAAPRGLAFDPMLTLNEPVSLWLLVLTVVLAALGAVVQFRDTTPMFGARR